MIYKVNSMKNSIDAYELTIQKKDITKRPIVLHTGSTRGKSTTTKHKNFEII